MVKKIKKNRSYSYNDRNIKPTLSDISGPIEEPLLDVNGETASIVKRFFAYLIDLAIYLPIAFVFQYMTVYDDFNSYFCSSFIWIPTA